MIMKKSSGPTDKADNMHAEMLQSIYDTLIREFGSQQWWPAETPFEVIVGAMLTQQTKWTNVEKAIDNLKQKNMLEAGKLAEMDLQELEEDVRCTGFYRQKAIRLKGISNFFYHHGEEVLFSLPAEKLRRRLLELKGIGPETADSILLYAAGKPCFVIDAYTTRIMRCIGIEGNYHQLQEIFEKNISKDVEIYKEYHALIVEYAKRYCVTRQCDKCLLKGNKDGQN
ncbi:DNA-3-methyladenine glycosylase III [Methanohalophilus portucalensis FDF-1]|uniref:DNA-3-methyladenine glycosylase III n=4 Tax=Methanohalophilus portucalensis TaxID=39664 RepID=A0A1X7NPG1_9EURY|nr:DNA-3-methyladenine glycosylase III [Methanohalophilus portucalensis FDF-1]